MNTQRMIGVIKLDYDLDDPQVLSAMEVIPRDVFVPKHLRHLAYKDKAIPIGEGQTISQPYTVAFMTHLLKPQKKDKVLEIGTGSGYQAAVLSKLVRVVYSTERLPKLIKKAKANLEKLKIKNVKIFESKGLGLSAHSPYDKIIVTAEINKDLAHKLLKQLKKDGILVAPIKGIMTKIVNKKDKKLVTLHGFFRFVPFVLNSK